MPNELNQSQVDQLFDDQREIKTAIKEIALAIKKMDVIQVEVNNLDVRVTEISRANQCNTKDLSDIKISTALNTDVSKRINWISCAVIAAIITAAASMVFQMNKTDPTVELLKQLIEKQG